MSASTPATPLSRRPQMVVRSRWQQRAHVGSGLGLRQAAARHHAKDGSGTLVRCSLRFGHSTLAAALAACLAAPAAATTYYVDGASSQASESNSGSSSSPMKTISAAVASHGYAGNVILVRPATYRETVIPGRSGASGTPLVLWAYVTGVTIDGAEDYTGTSKWKLLSGSVSLAAGVSWGPR